MSTLIQALLWVIFYMTFYLKICKFYRNVDLPLKSSSIIIMLLIFISCQDSNLYVIERRIINNQKQMQLGESQYFLRLPNNFTLSEARGKEGQLGYDIMAKDTTSTMFGFIEIEPGNPIGDNSVHVSSKVFAESYLLDKKVKWKISQTETGYFEAHSSHNGKLSAWASSKKRSEIDSLIMIISTLTRK